MPFPWDLRCEGGMIKKAHGESITHRLLGCSGHHQGTDSKACHCWGKGGAEGQERWPEEECLERLRGRGHPCWALAPAVPSWGRGVRPVSRALTSSLISTTATTIMSHGPPVSVNTGGNWCLRQVFTHPSCHPWASLAGGWPHLLPSLL